MKTNQFTIEKFDKKYSEVISEIIVRNLKEINSKDYSEDKINNLVLEFSPKKVEEFSGERYMLIALNGNEPIGTLSVAKSWDNIKGSYVFLTIFVNPDYHKLGIGNLLVEAGEEYVKSLKGHKIYIPSSISAHKFYNKLGYSYRKENLEPDEHGCIPMEKNINL